MEEEFPTGEQIVDAVKATEFVGVSGPVSFVNNVSLEHKP
jgi:hypothetical protein